MDALILLGAASGLPPLLPVGDGGQGVTGKPGDSLDIAVALAREAIDGVGSRHPGTRFLVDPGHPQARRRLRDDGKLPVAIGERGIVLDSRLLWQADSVRRLPAPVARANEHVDTTAPRVAARAEVTLHRAYRYSRPPRHTWARPSKPLFASSNRVCSRVQRRKRPARSYSATKPRRNPSKSSIASIRQNARPCLWSMAMSSKPDPKLGAGKSRLLARRLREGVMRATLLRFAKTNRVVLSS